MLYCAMTIPREIEEATWIGSDTLFTTVLAHTQFTRPVMAAGATMTGRVGG
jgi:hypothetical protein